MQRSAFASVDTLTAQIEVETGLRVRLRQQRVMRAAKFIMLMYTLRTSYTVLILTGFSLKHTAQIDLQSPCRQALFMLHTTSWFLTCRCFLNPAILQTKPTHGSHPRPHLCVQGLAKLPVLQPVPTRGVHRSQRSSRRVLHSAGYYRGCVLVRLTSAVLCMATKLLP